MVQGLAYGAQLPVVGVSTLAAMAQQAIATTGAQRVVSAIDARMSEVYLGQFVNHQGLALADSEEVVCSPDDAVAQLPAINYQTAGTGWQAYEPLQQARHNATNTDILYPHGRYMLALAQPKIAAGEGVEAMSVMPVYLRDKVTWKKLPGRE
jgi:tRNA threonylcarbamoyladenosine biosynthesis protein TsaB